MRIKPGVKFHCGHQAMSLACVIMEQCLDFITGGIRPERSAWVELVLTSASEGKHGENSLHYSGKAFDFRTRGLTTEQQEDWATLCRIRLDAEFDVVLEKDHLHVEWQPEE